MTFTSGVGRLGCANVESEFLEHQSRPNTGCTPFLTGQERLIQMTAAIKLGMHRLNN